jgi:plasmid stability protein
MANIQVRNVPSDVHSVLKERAAAAGMSLSEYLLAELTRLAALPTLAEWVDTVEGRTLYELSETSAEIIRRERESH